MFKQIRAKNLFSWHNLDYKILPGVSLIDGFNYDDNTSEGCGKSSIANILCWTLYGKVPKDVKIDDVISYGKTSGTGEVVFNCGHRVLRQRKPNVLALITPDGKKVMLKDAKETQNLIQSFVGLSFEAFCQAIYSSQNGNNFFLTSNEADKVSILSEVIDLSKFDSAKALCHSNLVELEPVLTDYRYKIQTTESQIAQTENAIQEQEKLVLYFEEDFAKDKSQVEELIKSLESLLENTPTEAENLERKQHAANLQEMRKSLESKLLEVKHAAKLESSYEQSKASLLQLLETHAQAEQETQELKQGTCPTCKQPVTQHVEKPKRKEIDVAKISKELKSLDGKIKDIKQLFKLVPEIETSLTKVKKEIAVIEQEILEASIQQKNFNLNKQALNRALEQKKDLEKQEAVLKDAKKKLIKLTSDAINLAHEKATFTKKIEDLQTKKARLTTLKTGFQDIKAYVFASVLTDLSEKTTLTARKLFEVPVKVNFYSEKTNGKIAKILTKIELDGVERSLGLLSGGQFRRIQLSVDLALSDIITKRAKKPFNFRVLDEPFKDLSESSMSKMVDLLGTLGGSTLLIEHNSIAKSVVNQTFFIEYRNGVSENAN